MDFDYYLKYEITTKHINNIDPEGLFPLWVNIYFANIERVNLLIKNGANVNLFNDDGMCPLLGAHLLTLKNDEDLKDKGHQLKKILIEAGADVNTKIDGCTVFHCICFKSNWMTKHLIDLGTDVFLRADCVVGYKYYKLYNVSPLDILTIYCNTLDYYDTKTSIILVKKAMVKNIEIFMPLPKDIIVEVVNYL